MLKVVREDNGPNQDSAESTGSLLDAVFRDHGDIFRHRSAP